jgi:hypothetical protein
MNSRRIAITLLAILFPTARRNALFRHTLDLLTLSASLCIRMCILCVSLPLSGDSGDMIDYPKESQEQFRMQVLGDGLDSRQIVFSLIHSFGGRGSPRS